VFTGFGELKSILPFDGIKFGAVACVLIELGLDLGKPVLVDTKAKSDRTVNGGELDTSVAE
jgi:hypothetical protein